MRVATLGSVAIFAITGCADLDEPMRSASEVVAGTTITATIDYAGYAFADPSPHVPFAAYQDGNGPWQALTVHEGLYSATITSDHYGIAIGVPAAGSNRARLSVFYATVAESTSATVLGTTPVPRPYSLILSFSNNSNAVVYYDGPSFASGNGGLMVPSRVKVADLVVVPQETQDLGNGKSEQVPSKILRMSRVDIEATPVVWVDFGLPLPGPMIYPALFDHGAATGAVSTLILSSPFSYTLGRSPQHVLGMSPSLARDGDVYLYSYTFDPAAAGHTYSGAYYTTTPGAMDFARGTIYNSPPPQLLTTPYLRPSTAVVAVSGELPFIRYVLNMSDPAHSYQINATAGWGASCATAALTLPDFSGIPGWTSDLALQPRTPLSWSFTRRESNTAQLAIPGNVFHDATSSGVIGEYCGNGVVEPAYEQCDPPDGTTCSAQCTLIAH